ncbi:MAG: DUF1287 domain-containing protein [Rhizobiaceae bacterium]
MISRRSLLALPLAFAVPAHAAAEAEPWAQKLIAAAKSQIGVTNAYDPAYRKLAFPGGDVPRQVGVCTDVVIRAFRDGLGIDLQALVNADMKRAFADYPKTWGLKRADSNIDHRRVPNLQTWFERRGASLPVTASADDYRAGDLITQMLPGNLPHIAIVCDELNSTQSALQVIHNIGGGARMEDTLFAFPMTGHYRYRPQA